MMRVLVACEYSGRVREAFRRRGHDAWSCDLLPAEDYSDNHLIGDALEIINGGPPLGDYGGRWDIIIAHPPCTDLAVSGARHFPAKIADGRQQRALDFVQALMDAPCDRIAIENPISVISSKIRKPDQIIQPWMFGHPETKATCLWLKGLPKLVPNDDAEYVKAHMESLPANQRNRVHHMPPGPDRWKERSRTYIGVAEAMAEQWGSL
jgi:site-specific DNA-cytosine methylase